MFVSVPHKINIAHKNKNIKNLSKDINRSEKEEIKKLYVQTGIRDTTNFSDLPLKNLTNQQWN